MNALGYFEYFRTIVDSNKKRNYIKKYGVDQAVSKYPNLGGKRIEKPDEIHEMISRKILSHEPFMVGRFGSIELAVTAKEDLGISYKNQQSIELLCNNAGFFPNDKRLIKKYSNYMIESMEKCDIQGVWYLAFEDYYVRKKLNSNVHITEGRYLEPWFSSRPWTSSLKGKKVLVIHPFADTIKKQYLNRQKLFQKEDYLPEFSLTVLKAVQTIAGCNDSRFLDWFEALEYMYKLTLKIDFDIAIIGCGAYGYPLAAMIKESGKQAIHMGGVTQAMFGIKGKRWEQDSNPIVRNLYNEYWVRPDSSEIPMNCCKVENGCYW